MNRDEIYLRHILYAIGVIRGYAGAGVEAFAEDAMRQDAIIRRLEIIGEAVKQLSDATRELEPEVPWRRIGGMRDRLIHGYAEVDLEIVWGVVEMELPRLEAAVRRLLAES